MINAPNHQSNYPLNRHLSVLSSECIHKSQHYIIDKFLLGEWLGCVNGLNLRYLSRVIDVVNGIWIGEHDTFLFSFMTVMS